MAHDNKHTSQATQKLIDSEVKRLLKVSPEDQSILVSQRAWTVGLSFPPKNAQSSSNSMHSSVLGGGGAQ